MFIRPQIYLVKGEYDDELYWPVQIKGRLQILNQAGEHDQNLPIGPEISTKTLYNTNI